MNKQRENIYALRRQILDGEIHLTDEDGTEEVLGTREYLMLLAEEILDSLVDTYAQAKADSEDWDLDALRREVTRVYAVDVATVDFADKTSDEIRDALWEPILASFEEKETLVGPDVMRRVARDFMLQIVDTQWKDHLYSLDHLREGITLRGYGQRDPLIEYKKESFAMFQAMKERVDEEIVRALWLIRPVIGGEEARVTAARRPQRAPLVLNEPAQQASVFAGAARSASAAAVSPFPAGGRAPRPAREGGDDAAVRTVRRDEPKVGRNDPCPCGSGKKYKKCHGAAA
jgi:preprotein translocase subunit SecA